MRVDEHGNKVDPQHLALRKPMRPRYPVPNLDDLFYALDDPARRAMVELLNRGPLPVSDVARSLPIEMTPALRHLQVLQVCGLARSEKVGKVRTFALQPGVLDLVAQWINANRSQPQDRPTV